jgi:hypothetical protein
MGFLAKKTISSTALSSGWSTSDVQLVLMNGFLAEKYFINSHPRLIEL